MTPTEAPAVFWCPGSGRLKSFDKPDRSQDLPMRECGIWRPHPPHSYADRPAGMKAPSLQRRGSRR